MGYSWSKKVPMLERSGKEFLQPQKFCFDLSFPLLRIFFQTKHFGFFVEEKQNTILYKIGFIYNFRLLHCVLSKNNHFVVLQNWSRSQWSANTSLFSDKMIQYHLWRTMMGFPGHKTQIYVWGPHQPYNPIIWPIFSMLMSFSEYILIIKQTLFEWVSSLIPPDDTCPQWIVCFAICVKERFWPYQCIPGEYNELNHRDDLKLDHYLC